MRYTEKTFTVALTSDLYRDQWERVFGGTSTQTQPPDEGQSDLIPVECEDPTCACNCGANRKNQP